MIDFSSTACAGPAWFAWAMGMVTGGGIMFVWTDIRASRRADRNRRLGINQEKYHE